MKFIATTIAATLMLGTAATAQGLVVAGTHAGGNFSLYVGPAGNGLGKVLHMDEPMNVEAQERDARWVAYCRPKISLDAYGVARYGYAHSGCEFGRDR